MYHKYFNAEYYKDLYCYRNNSIDLCESFEAKSSIILNEIDIKTLKFNSIENLQELDIRGTNCIMTNNNTHIEEILDFTIFPSLTTIYLQNVKCTEIKFGNPQTKIMIKSSKIQLKHLDFTKCHRVESIDEYCKVDVVSLASHRIQFKYCDVKLINLCSAQTHFKLRKFASACTGSCKWIVQYKKNTTQRILYKMHEHRSKDYKRDCAYKYFFKIPLGIMLLSKLQHIWENIRQMMYE